MAKERAENDFDRDVRLAWHIEAMQRQQKLPPLKQLLSRGKPQSQSEAEKRASIDEFRGRHGLSSKRVRLVQREVVH